MKPVQASYTQGQYNAKTMVSFAACRMSLHCSMANTNLCCSVTERLMCMNNMAKVITGKWNSRN